MATTVEIGVYYTTPDAPYFRLNSATKGRLNNASYRLAGAVYYDITDRVRSVNVSRGKNREFDRYSAGQVTVSLNNDDRYFDPLNTESFLFGSIIPRRQLRVRSGGFDQFVGVIDDWNYEYDISGQSLAAISASDNFVSFAQQSLTAGTASVQTSGARIDAVLSQPSVAWPLDRRQVDVGNAVLNADVFDGNVLSYLQQVEASEQGQLFMTRDGDVRFVDGATAQASTSWPVLATNLVTNPSMETGSGTVTVRTNLSENPLMVTGTYPLSNNATNNPVVKNTAVPAAHPLGITTCLMSSSTGTNSALLTIYSADGRINTGSVERTMGAYVYVNEAGYQITASGGWSATPLTANTWTWVQQTTATVAGAYASLFINKISGNASTTARAYVTGLIAESGTVAPVNYFDGSFSPAGDFTYSWAGTVNASASVQSGVGVAGNTTQGPAAAIQSGDWFSTGTKSIRLIPTTSANNNRARFPVSTTVGKTYTAKAKIRLTDALTGALNGFSRTIRVTNLAGTQLAISDQAPNAAVVYELSVSFTATETTTNIELWVGASIGAGDVWWDDLIVVGGTYTGGYFDGSTADTFREVFYWTGTPNASTSIAKQSEYIYFADDTTGIPYTGATVSYGTELLYNQITVTFPAGTAIADNTGSQASYGIISTDIDSVLSNDTQATTLAEYLANKYGQPEYRFEAIQINLLGVTGDQANAILQTELGDIAAIRFTPNGVGSPIERACIITSIKQAIGVDSHIVSLGFASIPFSSLVLDDYGFGILDSNTLSI